MEICHLSCSVSQNSMTGDKITVCSLNVRGASTIQMRRELFYGRKKIIYFSISDKKCTEQEKQKSVGNPNGDTQLFLQIFYLQSRCCILFNNFHFQILEYFIHPEGRFIIADRKIQYKTLTLVNIYFLAREKWFTLNGRAMALNLKFNGIFACSNMILEKASVVNYVSVLIEKQEY